MILTSRNLTVKFEYLPISNSRQSNYLTMYGNFFSISYVIQLAVKIMNKTIRATN